MRILPVLFLHLSLLCLIPKAFSTHNRAGDITYKYISNLTYEITVTTYTKESSQADRCELEIYFGDGDSAAVQRTNGITSGSCAPAGMGVSVANAVDIKMNIYSCMHTYPNMGTYLIHMQDPNRNGGTLNIPNSINSPFHIESLLVIGFCPTNSIQFSSAPVLELPKTSLSPICRQNVGVTLFNNDSITFELVACMEDSGTSCLGYTFPPGLTLNRISGEMTWNTDSLQIGQYDIAIKISEWRNGILVGYVLRESQIDVYASGDPRPFFSGISGWNSGPFGYTYSLTPGNSFSISLTYKNLTGSILALTPYGEAFSLMPKATFTTQAFGSDSIQGQFSWTPDVSEGRSQPYILTFRGASNGSSGTTTTDITLLLYVDGNNPVACQVTDVHWERERNAAQLSLFPNPASDKLVLKTTKEINSSVSLLLSNALGQLVWVKNNVQANTEISIDRSKLLRGLYFYELRNSEFRETGKILIE